MKVLVTGGLGFIGCWLVDTLLRDGHDRSVVVLDDLSGGYEENLDMRTPNPRATLVKGSITDEVLVKNLFDEYKFDFVFHAAAYAAEGLSHFIRKFNYENNLIGSINLINNSVRHNAKCFVFLSSIAVYGSGQVPFSEDNIPMPEDPYGISKYAVEMDLRAAHEMFGLNYIVFRPHNVYGERQNLNDPYRNVVGIFIRQVLEGKPCSIFGDGSQTRAFTYVQDIAPYITRSIDYPKAYNRVFNIGSDNYHSIFYVARMVQQTLGKDTGIVHMPERLEVKHAYSRHNAFENVFGSVPETSLDVGLRAMANWAKGSVKRPPQKFDKIEIEKNMPVSWRSRFDS